MGRLKVLHETIGTHVTPARVLPAAGEHQSMVFEGIVNAQLQVGIRQGYNAIGFQSPIKADFSISKGCGKISKAALI